MGVRQATLEPRPVVPLPGEWTFWADMITTGEPLGPVEVSGFGYTSRLSGFGNGSVSLTLPCGLAPARLLRLWSWRLWCFYDGQLVWCGVPSGVTDEDGSVRVGLTLTELPGYLQKRVFDEHPRWATPPGGLEQTEIARRLAEPVADVGVRIVTQPGTGVLRDRVYEFLESDHRGQLLANLAGVLDGPEFRAEYGMTAQGPECVLRIAYPRVGSGAAGLGVSVPGTALGFRASWDADQLRTKTFAVGDLPDTADPGAAKPVATVDRPQLPDLPRLDAVDNWPGTVLVSTLAQRAATMATQQAAPALALTASPPNSLPPLGSYQVGDDVTLRAATPLLEGGLEALGRLVELSVSAGEARATWTVATAMPPPVPRETLARALGRLTTTTSALFRSGPTQAPTEAP